MNQVRNDLTGQVFGRLTVLSFACKDKNKNSKWNCLCECGKSKIVWASALTRGLTKSCGCLLSEASRERRTTHGKSGGKDTTYNIWAGMIKRCSNPNAHNYNRYGGRGIKVCERWHDFAAFLEDMGPNPKGYSIERLDIDKGYEPDNCTWIPKGDQSRNKSTSRRITANGQTMLLVDWAAKTGIHEATISSRVDKLGWTPEKAVTTPVRPTRPRLAD